MARKVVGSTRDKAKRCKDCPADGPKRPAPYPGPRCATHHREVRKARAKASHNRRLVRIYTGVKEGDYEKIVDHQAQRFHSGDRCPICHRAKIVGRKRRAALEHDHGLDWPRGVVCARCNEYIGWIADDPKAAKRLRDYLIDPPAWAVVGPPPGT